MDPLCLACVSCRGPLQQSLRAMPEYMATCLSSCPTVPSWSRLLGSLIRILSTSFCLYTKEVATSGPDGALSNYLGG